jgi:hypothetical protein
MSSPDAPSSIFNRMPRRGAFFCTDCIAGFADFAVVVTVESDFFAAAFLRPPGVVLAPLDFEATRGESAVAAG